MKVLFNIVAVLVSKKSQVLQGQGPGWPRRRTFAQGQGQGQGLKICPRGHLKAEDQGQGQQHWCIDPSSFQLNILVAPRISTLHALTRSGTWIWIHNSVLFSPRVAHSPFRIKAVKYMYIIRCVAVAELTRCCNQTPNLLIPPEKRCQSMNKLITVRNLTGAIVDITLSRDLVRIGWLSRVRDLI